MREGINKSNFTLFDLEQCVDVAAALGPGHVWYTNTGNGVGGAVVYALDYCRGVCHFGGAFEGNVLDGND